ncbi:helix-turn-helix transcriptional regulator [Dictyobacter arantiisoli]|uniref:Transcriptional regulator n=1 Tax=Dictyobacter arantiisoli TaxID=2014874 RepID=A0A5A5T744_9CHLR|nr:helix-turn-helix transcriptional regulator [Dictyobacter arantiisoli]GCF06823.1 transcriptional regulator [Dictyobacter arantiisoli]
MKEQERRSELAQFLRTRRERISPSQVGLPMGTRRRTPGLRREELALVAGVGTTWYTWLEQGRDIIVSTPIVESLARALQLDADERAHLFVLAREQLPATPFPAEDMVDPALQLILETMGVYPAYVVCPSWHIIAWNQAACQVYADFSTMSPRERNFLWFLFTDQRLRTRLVNWEGEAQHALALFRASTQRYIGEAWLTKIITDLEQVSPEFREWWPRYDVQGVHTGQQHLDHPLVGLLRMQATTFQLADHPGLRMMVYTPVSGTDTIAKLTALSESGSRLQSLKAV